MSGVSGSGMALDVLLKMNLISLGQYALGQHRETEIEQPKRVLRSPAKRAPSKPKVQGVKLQLVGTDQSGPVDGRYVSAIAKQKRPASALRLVVSNDRPQETVSDREPTK